MLISKLSLLCGLSPILLLSLGVRQGVAQITPDGTLGTESSRVRAVNHHREVIEGGAIRGSHLFHSFDEFNVGAGRSAYFENPAGVLNIFSRVTGNSGSTILGTLGVDGMANLYLLNPNGIVFGPNAQLDVSGSFVASTANRLVFDDGQFFGAVAPNQPPLLQINVTPGLQYGNNLSATISNQGNLQVGQNLTLGAQRLDLAGSLTAGRDIVLQGWSRQLSNADYTVGGYVFTQDLSGQGIDLLIPHENVILANGDVRFTQNYTGESLHVLAGGQVRGAAGANNITITGTSGGSVTEQIATGTGGFQTVTVTASDQPTVDIRSGVNWSQLPGGLPGNLNTSEAAVTFGVATGGNITLGNITNNGGDIALWAAGELTANNLDTSVSISSVDEDIQAEDGGAITLWAGQDISVHNLNSFSSAVSETGNIVGADGGTIYVTAGNNIDAFKVDSSWSNSNNLFPFNRDFNTTSGNVVGGDGGDIFLVAGSVLSLYSIDSFSNSSSDSDWLLSLDAGDVTGGDGGNIVLVTGSALSLHSINSSSDSISFSMPLVSSLETGNVIGGDGGDITLDSGNSISLYSIDSSSSSSSDSSSLLSLDTGDVSGGDGGNVILAAKDDISCYSIYTFSSSSSFSQSELPLDTGNVTGGDGGDISLIAGNDIVSSRFIDSSSYSSSNSYAGNMTGGDGGNVSLVAGNEISIDSITADSFSSSFSFSSLSSSLAGGNRTGGNGGNVSLVAGDKILIHSIDSSSSSFSNLFLSSENITGGNMTGGNGGNVSLVAGDRILIHSIDSFSYSFSDIGDVIGGDGGNISLKVEAGSISGFVQQVITCVGDPCRSSIDTSNPSFQSFSVSEGGKSGNGGSVALEAAIQIGTENSDYLLEILTLSSAADSGAVQITGLGENLDILNTSVIASKTVEIENPLGFGEPIRIPVGETGQSGNVNISGSGDLTFTNSSFLSDTNGPDPAGTVTVRTPGVITFDNSFINTNTQSTGTAGDIQVTASQIILQNGSEISTSTTEAGAAGNITFNTGIVEIIDGSEVLATTSGTGDSGRITINATDSVLLGEGIQDFAPVISVETSGAGTAGDIFINTPNFVLSETARITATATATATNPQGGGSITISADQMNLAGIVGIFAETQGQAPGGVLTLQPYQTNPNLDIRLAPGARISASTYGSGNGGDLIVAAPQSIAVSGAGELAVETFGTGTAGNIEMSAQRLLLTDGVTISASTNDSGTAGNITLNADNLTIQNGARVITNTAGSGDAGDIKFNVSNILDINNATVAASTEIGSTGNSGDINIDPTLTQIRNGGTIVVNSAGQGEGGSIFLVSDNLFLDRGSITAETLTSNGGNINLMIQNLMLMENFSLISASAGTAQAGGNGGNITIYISDGFLIAPAGADSDIVAQAYEGNGGNINITARGIYGFTEQTAVRGNGMSDIDASSQFGQAGTVTLNDLLVNPAQSTLELPANVESLPLSQGCQPGRDGRGRFINIEQGGVPPNLSDSLASTSGWEDVQPIASDTSNHDQENVRENAPTEIVEAEQWHVNSRGQLVLDTYVASRSVVYDCQQ